MVRAADWLVATQDADGAWTKHPTPFAEPGLKAYETHVAWGLIEAFRARGDQRYLDAALRQVRWAITKQRPNGWVEDCCLSEPTHPLTHTLGYFLRGVLEAHRASGDADLRASAVTMARGLLPAIGPDGFLPGRLTADWKGAVPFACLTGSVQIGHCLLILADLEQDETLRAAGRRLNTYVRRTIALDGPPETRGGVKGSFPVDGPYGQYHYLNWAAKFFVDSHLLDATVGEQPEGASR
jgi:hypothetical protein